MKYYIIAGEASGDLHAAGLIAELKKKDAQANIRAWGGDLMQAEGAELVKHYSELAFMGFAEVITNLRTIMRNLDFCKSDIAQFNPDALILVDYPGFNMRIAAFAKSKNIPVYYYISPQVWAWKQNRVHKLKATVDRMYVILPFEKEFYARFGMDVHYVGHPLLDGITRFKAKFSSLEAFCEKHGLDHRPIVALLPGSRKQEISRMLPVMVAAARRTGIYQYVIAGAPGQAEALYRSFEGANGIRVISGATYELLHHSRAAMVTSGTATLETALLNVPQVVCYKGSAISYQIAKRLIKVKYISLVNLIMQREVIKELIQGGLNETSLAKEIEKLCGDDGYRSQIHTSYAELREILGGEGAASHVANDLWKSLQGMR